MNDNRFYVYALLDPRKQGNYKYGEYEFDYEPFYIGKGTGCRIYKHFAKTALIPNTPKTQKILKILSLGLKPITIKINSNIIETDALSLENKLIKLIGRKDINTGILCNGTDGGENGGQRIIKETTRQKISISLIGKNKGRKLTKEWKNKIKKNNARFWKNKHHSTETIEKIKNWRANQDMSYRFKQYKLTNPDGQEFIINNGLQKFCDTYKLNRPHLLAVAKGERNHSKGWKCEIISFRQEELRNESIS